jgi:oligopeptide transport system substrate-binding protein
MGHKPLDQLGVRVLNELTLQITLQKVTPYLLEKLKQPVGYAVPRHIIKKYGKDWTKIENIQVSGAFKISKWKKGKMLTLVKNDKFFDAKNVRLDKVVFYPNENVDKELEMYANNKLDITSDIPPSNTKILRRRFRGQVYSSEFLSVYYYPINTKRITDIKIRKAMSLAVNRVFITDFILKQGQQPTYSFVPKKINNYDSEQPYPHLEFQSNLYSTNLNEAKKIMKQAGYNSKNPLKITLSFNGNVMNESIAKVVKAMWKRVYIDVTFKVNTFQRHYYNLQNGNYDVGYAHWVGGYNDPSAFIGVLLNNSYNVTGYFNKKWIDIVDKANKTSDIAVRADLLKQVEQEALDSYTLIPIFHSVSKHLVSQRVRGWKRNVLDVHRSRWMSLR